MNTWSWWFDKWAELIKSLKTQFNSHNSVVSKFPTNVPTTHNVTMSLSRDNLSIKTQKYALFPAILSCDFCGLQSKSHRLRRCARQMPVTPAHWSDLALRMSVEGTQAFAVPKAAMDLTLEGGCATRSKTICTFHNFSSCYNLRSTSSLVRNQSV